MEEDDEDLEPAVHSNRQQLPVHTRQVTIDTMLNLIFRCPALLAPSLISYESLSRRKVGSIVITHFICILDFYKLSSVNNKELLGA
jgi:hypothetical protein